LLPSIVFHTRCPRISGPERLGNNFEQARELVGLDETENGGIFQAFLWEARCLKEEVVACGSIERAERRQLKRLLSYDFANELNSFTYRI